MTEFIRNGGFIGPSFGKWVVLCRRNHAEFFQLADETNRLAHVIVAAVANKLSPVSKGEQERLALALLLRGVGLFQAVVLLAERGMVAEAGIITRSLVEAEFRLAVAAKSPENAAQLIVNDTFEKRTSLRSVLTVPQCVTPAQNRKLEAKIKWLDNALAGKKRKFHSLEQLAGRAGQSDIYNLFFRGFSGPVHSSPTDLKQHAQATSDRKQVRFGMGPRFELVPFYLSMAGFIHLKFLEVATNFFGVDAEATLKNLNRRLKGFGPKVRTPIWE